jgi:hypothetical protein
MPLCKRLAQKPSAAHPDDELHPLLFLLLAPGHAPFLLDQFPPSLDALWPLVETIHRVGTVTHTACAGRYLTTGDLNLQMAYARIDFTYVIRQALFHRA